MNPLYVILAVYTTTDKTTSSWTLFMSSLLYTLPLTKPPHHEPSLCHPCCIHYHWQNHLTMNPLYVILAVYTTTDKTTSSWTLFMSSLMYTPPLAKPPHHEPSLCHPCCTHYHWQNHLIMNPLYVILAVYTTTGKTTSSWTLFTSSLLYTPPLAKPPHHEPSLCHPCCIHHHWQNHLIMNPLYVILAVHTTIGKTTANKLILSYFIHSHIAFCWAQWLVLHPWFPSARRAVTGTVPSDVVPVSWPWVGYIQGQKPGLRRGPPPLEGVVQGPHLNKHYNL